MKYANDASSRYLELKEQIAALSPAHSGDGHIDLERAICHDPMLSAQQQQTLLGVLFVTSLRRGVLHYHHLYQRIDSLIAPAASSLMLAEILPRLKTQPDYFCQRIRQLIEALFATPSGCPHQLIRLALWVSSYPALLPDEQESLASLARLYALVLEQAAAGDACAQGELARARNTWYINAIIQADSLEALAQLQCAILAEIHPDIWQAPLIALLGLASNSLERSGALPAGQCLATMMQAALQADPGQRPDYGQAVCQMMRWFAGFIQSPALALMLERGDRSDPPGADDRLYPAFRTRALMFFSHN